MLLITNMATVRIFKVVCDKLNVPGMCIQSTSPSYVIITLQYFVAS